MPAGVEAGGIGDKEVNHFCHLCELSGTDGVDTDTLWSEVDGWTMGDFPQCPFGQTVGEGLNLALQMSFQNSSPIQSNLWLNRQGYLIFDRPYQY